MGPLYRCVLWSSGLLVLVAQAGAGIASPVCAPRNWSSRSTNGRVAVQLTASLIPAQPLRCRQHYFGRCCCPCTISSACGHSVSCVPSPLSRVSSALRISWAVPLCHLSLRRGASFRFSSSGRARQPCSHSVLAVYCLVVGCFYHALFV